MDYALIMAGGAGTRLWPLSREHLPKPALRLYGVQSMFEIAVERLLPLFPPEQILVVASADHNQVLHEQVPSIPETNFIVEPEGRAQLRQSDWRLFTSRLEILKRLWLS